MYPELVWPFHNAAERHHVILGDHIPTSLSQNDIQYVGFFGRGSFESLQANRVRSLASLVCRDDRLLKCQMHPFALSRGFVILICFIVFANRGSAGLLSVKIVDEYDRPTPARVYLTDDGGKALFPIGTITYDKSRPNGVAERHFVPRDGSFRTELPAGSYTLVVDAEKNTCPSLRVSQYLRRATRDSRFACAVGRTWRVVAGIPAICMYIVA